MRTQERLRLIARLRRLEKSIIIGEGKVYGIGQDIEDAESYTRRIVLLGYEERIRNTLNEQRGEYNWIKASLRIYEIQLATVS